MERITQEEVERIKSLILTKPIFSLISDSCSFCSRLINSLTKMEYLEKTLLIREEGEYRDIFRKIREVVSTSYGHKTVPVVFINGWFVGGYDNFKDISSGIDRILNSTVLDRVKVLTEEGRIKRLIEGYNRTEL